MEDEIEDIVGEVKFTDSQKSVAISNVYSTDFTDSSSDRQNSSGKNTYVIEQDDSDTESFELRNSKSVINLSVHNNEIPPCDGIKINRGASTSLYGCSYVSQEIFTQTSKTILELADIERNGKAIFGKSLETQTSFISITNQKLQYTLEVSNTIQSSSSSTNDQRLSNRSNEIESFPINQLLNISLDDGSSKLAVSETENTRAEDDISCESENIILKFQDEESKVNVLTEEQNGSDSDYSPTYSDIEDDSLMECNKAKSDPDSHSDTSEVPVSVDNDIEELYNKLSESIDLHNLGRQNYLEKRTFSLLTPLTEETAAKKDSLMDITPDVENIVSSKVDADVVFTSNTGTRVKILPKEETHSEQNSFKLPSIGNRSCPSSPQLNFLFNDKSCRPFSKSEPLPCLLKSRNERNIDRLDIGKGLASGESTLIGRSNETPRNKSLHLPRIHIEGHAMAKVNSYDEKSTFALDQKKDPISVRQKIKELKMSRISTNSWMQGKHNTSASNSRNASPSSGSPSRRSQDESVLGDAATRGCEVLCVELIRRLRSASWVEVVDTLEELPKVLEKFWGVITEHRITDLIRYVCSHVESPRTQVARAACDTLASILKTTNYTKKPDFYEAIAILLTKTGSFSRPVRRAANVALDDIVCGVDLCHAVTAICVHGVDHKSPLVRCASSRLLVVSCALAGGGRELLRSRPQSAVCARKHVLQALAVFLYDKNTETRKYAERLYSMLRPLTNFEAYYLTDVDVEIATRQMKKYDDLLLCGPPKASR